MLSTNSDDCILSIEFMMTTREYEIQNASNNLYPDNAIEVMNLLTGLI